MPDVLDQVAPLAHWLEASLDAPFSDKYDGQCFNDRVFFAFGAPYAVYKANDDLRPNVVAILL
jgi:hypothetical protein